MIYIVSSIGIECPESGRFAITVGGVDNRRFKRQWLDGDTVYGTADAAVTAIVGDDDDPHYLLLMASGEKLPVSLAETLEAISG